MRNAFGHQIPLFSELLAERRMFSIILDELIGVLSHLGVERERASSLAKQLLSAASSISSIDYERTAHEVLVSDGLLDRLPSFLRGRTEIIHQQIREYVGKGVLVDIGCGDGEVGQSFSWPGVEVRLCDVYKHPRIDSLSAPFAFLQEGGRLPYPDGSADTALVLTVLHHANDPLHLLSEAVRILKPGGTLVVIESVFGVGDIPPDLLVDERNQMFLKRSFEEQRLTNIYFDHFYNRIVHHAEDPKDKVNVPYNFSTPEQWNRLLEAAGCAIKVVSHLGIDQPIVPEYHTLHVAVRQEGNRSGA